MLTFDTLYSWVKDLPIIDWHNHLDLRMLAEDRPLGSLYEVWVKSDPYKHRAMRICGEPEWLITGTGTTDVPSVEEDTDTGRTDVPSVGCVNGQDVRCPSLQRTGRPLSQCNGQDVRCPSGEDAKWAAWMRTLPKLVGNPLFAWAKMELEWLGLDAEAYLHGRGENISLADWTPSKMLKRFNVEYLSPCVSPSQLPALEGTALGQRTSRPLASAPLGQRTSCPLAPAPLGQRTSRPLASSPATDGTSVVPVWTAPEVKYFHEAQSMVSGHFSHTLQAGDYHRRNLPHIGQASTLVFLTFRLADSLPQSRLDELAAFRAEWNNAHPEPWTEADRQEFAIRQFEKMDKWLDAGHGSCILADARLRKVVEDALEFFNATERTDVPSVGCVNGQDVRCPSGVTSVARTSNGKPRYRLHGYIVMPNHVHVLMELFDKEELPKIVQSWKGYTAKEINRLTGRTGTVWMAEYYDRLIRNAEHYANTLRYIRENGEVARRLAESNGQDVRCPSATDKMSVVPVQRTRCPLSQFATDGTSVVPVCNGQNVRCPGVVPSLRMNAGEEVAIETLERFGAAGCRIVDISVDDVSQLTQNYNPLAVVAAYAAAHGWTMLLHLGALRETSARLRAAAGPAGGFAGMRAPVDPAAVATFLDRLETGTTDVPSVGNVNGQNVRCPSMQRTGCPLSQCNGQDVRCPSGLPRTILLSLNPEAHAQLAVLAGGFNGEGMPGKVQLGPAWWWCDHEEGIRDVLEKSAAYGVLSTFIGMTTDSRSLLSFVRHDYFRRILCKWVAEKVAVGAFPDDEALLRPMLENICYRNAALNLKSISKKRPNETGKKKERT